MKRKKLLIVVDDPLEYKLLINDLVLKPLINKFEVTLACPAAKDSNFKKEIHNHYNVSFLPYFPENRIKENLQKGNIIVCVNSFIYYYIKQLAFFSFNFNRSESAFQKISLLLGWKINYILKRKHIGLRRLISSIVKIIFYPFKNIIYSKTIYIKPKISKIYTKFDHILFGGPDSVANIQLFHNHSQDKNKTQIITLCRNFDSPALKGIYTIPSDITYYYDEDQKIMINKFLDKRFTGRLVKIPYFLTKYKKNRIRNKSIFRVLFPSGTPSFVKNQDKILNVIYNTLESYCNNFLLVLRIHPNDSLNNYDIRNKKNLLINDEFFDKYITYSKKIHLYYGENNTKKFINNLANTDVILSPASTIVYEGMLCGAKCFFLNYYNDLDTLYKREHLKMLIKKGVVVINNKDELVKVLIEAYSKINK